MTKILKYTLPAYACTASIQMPASATILSAREQGEDFRLWVAVDPGERNVTRNFVVLATGDEVPDGLEFLGTASFYGGVQIYHAFEVVA